MKYKKTSGILLSLCAISFAHAANVWFGIGTHSASEYTASLSTLNVLASNASGRFLVFNDTANYVIGNINLRNTDWTGSDSGIFIQSGSLAVSTVSSIGTNDLTRGTLEVSGGTLTVGTTLYLGPGRGSLGILTVSAGNLATSTLAMGTGAGSTALMTVSGGTVTAAYTVIGSGIGNDSTLTINGGDVNITGTLAMGGGGSSRTNLIMSGDNLTVSNPWLIASGTPTVSTISATTSTTLRDTIANVSISGGTVSLASNMNIGAGVAGNGYGVYGNVFIGGTSSFYNTLGFFTMGNGAGATGTATISDNAQAQLFKVIVADVAGSTGSMTINGSAAVSVSSYIVMGNRGSNNTSLNVAGNASLSGQNIDMCNQTDSSALLHISENGRVILNSGLNVMSSSLSTASSATVLVEDDAYLSVAGGIKLGTGAVSSGAAELSVNGGTLTASSLSAGLSSSGALSTTVSVTNGGVATIAGALIATSSYLTVDSSNLSVGGKFYTIGTDRYFSVTNSTVTLGSLEVHFAANTATIAASTLNVQGASTIAPTRTSYTGRLFVQNGSQVNVGDNGYVGIGQVYIGDVGTGSFTMTSGAALLNLRLVLGSNAEGTSTGTGTLSVLGGTLTSSGTATAITVGNGGTGHLEVGGTGVIYAKALNMFGDATFHGNLYAQGVQAVAVTSEGQATFDTVNMTSGAVFEGGTVTVAENASNTLTVSGTAATYESVTFANLVFEGSNILNVDFSGLTVEGAMDITLLLADTMVGGSYLNISTTGLAEEWQVAYSESVVGSQTALIASISAIPEPALAALIAGALALTAAVRRRR